MIMANSRTTPHDLRPERDVDSNLAYLPTAEQIAAECRRIQAEWSLDEKRKRTAGVTAADDWETQGQHVLIAEQNDRIDLEMP